MKILHVLRDLSRNGGVQRLVFDMANSKQAGLEISVLITNRESGAEYIDELRKNGVIVHLIPRWNLLAHFFLYRQFDIVHAHLFPALYLVGLLANKKVYTEHNTNNNRRNIPLARFIEYFIYKRFDSITCITPEVKSSLLKFLKVEELSNTSVIYNGVDTAAFINENKNTRNDRYCNIAMIGSLTPKKDQETIIKALTCLGDDCVLHLAGNGERKEELINLVSKLDVTNRVVFHGLIKDIPSFLSRMDIYVQSSKFEGFGLAAVEGMAANLPVLCSDVPGLAELTGSKDGLFTQGDYQQLADCIERVNRDVGYKDLLLDMGRITSEKYSLVAMNENLYRLYEDLN